MQKNAHDAWPSATSAAGLDTAQLDTCISAGEQDRTQRLPKSAVWSLAGNAWPVQAKGLKHLDVRCQHAGIRSVAASLLLLFIDWKLWLPLQAKEAHSTNERMGKLRQQFNEALKKKTATNNGLIAKNEELTAQLNQKVRTHGHMMRHARK